MLLVSFFSSSERTHGGGGKVRRIEGMFVPKTFFNNNHILRWDKDCDDEKVSRARLP